MRLPTHAALIPFALASLACGDRSAASANAPVAVLAEGLSTPESVLWDATRNVWYVSNINGSPTAKDGNGYILRLTADGARMDSLPYINGADADITLHAPKGMALVADTLWVADIDALRAFDVNTGKAVTTLELSAQGATFLNDVAAGPDGRIYITDSGIAFASDGSVTHPGKSRVFVLDGRNAREAVVLPAQSAANGIARDAANSRWLIVGFNSQNIFAWSGGRDSVTVVGTGPGGGDGLVFLADGRALYSSWADSSLTVFADGVSTQLRSGLNAPADLGYDPARRLVAVPLFLDNRVEFWTVK
ncbi:MAG: SMP-30/gluconolactonase/LRE family protein [Gemmatimonadaceae bacterium]|nr:SMP-30/gluconolactonase/LRE family protein [Gemmatimonadaceae bacterium]